MDQTFDKNKDINELLAQYENLIHYVLHKKYPSLEFNEDALQEGRIALWQAIQTYDETKGSFMTWAHSCIYNRMAQILRREFTDKRQANLNCSSLDGPLKEYTNLGREDITLYDILSNTSLSVDYNITTVELKMLLEEFFEKKQLLKRDKDIFIKYIVGYTQQELGKEYGVSRSMVCRIVQRTQEKLKSFLSTSFNNTGVTYSDIIAMS